MPNVVFEFQKNVVCLKAVIIFVVKKKVKYKQKLEKFFKYENFVNIKAKDLRILRL